MLPLWHLLEKLREGYSGIPDDLRNEYGAGIAVHDLAAKVVAIKGYYNFDMLVSHLRMLTQGAVHLTQEPPANADVYNELIEFYWPVS